MNLKFIATGVVSAGVGAALAWAITADRAEARARLMADDYLKMQESLREKTRENIALRYEIDDKNAELENLHGAIDEHTGFADSENSPGEDSPETVSDDDFEEHEPTDEENDAMREQLRAQIRGYIPSEEDNRVFLEQQGGPVIASTKYDPPFVISQPEYAVGEEGEDYAKITLRYFPHHQTLLDEDDEPVEDVDRYVGWRSLKRFGDESGNENIVYVRNRNMDTDFEVEKVEDEDLPLHVKYGMPRIEFLSQKNAGKLALRSPEEDM